jgi:hypothetical protein
MTDASTWRPCNMCKKPIAFGATYWVCSVSTCNRLRTRLHFCTVECWDAHLPGARHREAWAEEETAPSGRAQADASRGGRGSSPDGRDGARTGSSARSAAAPAAKQNALSRGDDVLVVTSRLKSYIRAQSGMSTSDRVVGPLSDVIRRLCDEAIGSARRAHRETVLDRDVPAGDERRPAWLGR